MCCTYVNRHARVLCTHAGACWCVGCSCVKVCDGSCVVNRCIIVGWSQRMEDEGRSIKQGRSGVVQEERSVNFSDVCLPFSDTQVGAHDRIYP